VAPLPLYQLVDPTKCNVVKLLLCWCLDSLIDGLQCAKSTPPRKSMRKQGTYRLSVARANLNDVQ